MTPTGSLPDLLRDVVDRAAPRHVGLAVGVLRGNVAAVHGTGVVAEGGPAPDAGTSFQIGSVTKTVTALALADAVVRGDVDLGTPLTATCPGTPASEPPVELRHLGAHTAGLPRLPPGLWRTALRHRDDPYQGFTDADLEAALARTRLRGHPGERYRYSNFGFGLLGAALARHTGLPYPTLVARRVLEPLGLTATGVVTPAERATGHARRGRPTTDWDMGALLGAGALWSTVDDLLRLLGAHLRPDGTPLEEALRLVQQPQLRVAAGLEIALAWHRTPIGRSGPRAIWHNGGTGGFRSFVGFVPETGAAVAVLSNGLRPVDGLGRRLLQAAGG